VVVNQLKSEYGYEEVTMAQARLTVELDPTLRRRVEIAARSRDTSVRLWIEEAVRRELERGEAGGESFARISVPSFERDWSSEEDAIYDELSP
jgi:hypothetical protein